MTKIKITGSEYSDTDLEKKVCSHLLPILEFLEAEGATWDKNAKLYTDKGGAHTLKINMKINFNKVAENFEIPSFIELSEEYHSIICRKCWCDIEGC